MEYDNYIINNQGNDLKIYPLVELNENNQNYLIYAKEIKDKYEINDIYIGELEENKLKPIDNNLIDNFTNKLNDIIKYINNNMKES